MREQFTDDMTEFRAKIVGAHAKLVADGFQRIMSVMTADVTDEFGSCYLRYSDDAKLWLNYRTVDAILAR